MTVTKVLGFTNDELATLTEAGGILGIMAKEFSKGSDSEVTVLDDSAKQLVAALKDVLGRLE